MKKIFLLLAVFSVGLISYASTSESKMFDTEVPQVCQFSVSPSAGKISVGTFNGTESFTVSVSCVQTVDKRATVRVYVEEVCVGSAVVTVPAGKYSSELTHINVSKIYEGKHYILTVE